MSEQFLDGADVAAVLEQVRRERMAQSVWRRSLGDSRSAYRVLDDALEHGLVQVMPAHIMRMLAAVEAMPIQSLEQGVPWSWESYGEYLDALDRGLGVNVMSLAPHSTIRYHVMGDDARKRPATAESE